MRFDRSVLRNAVLAAALAAGVAAAAAAGAPPEATPSKTGTASEPAAKKVEVSGVVAGPDGKPVSGATVRILRVAEKQEKAPRRPQRSEPAEIKPAVAKTGDDGAFRLKELLGSTFRVRVEAPGFAPFLVKDIPAGAALTIRLKPGAAARVRVIDLDTKRPIAGASVAGRDSDCAAFGEDACRKAATGEDGRVRFGNLAPGLTTFEAIAPGHARNVSSPVTVRPAPAEGEAEPAETLVYLRPGARFSGRVLSSDGKPLEGAIVRVTPAELDLLELIRGSESPHATTDVQGRFDLDGLPAGQKLKLGASKKGLPAAEAGPFTVEAGRDRTGIEIRVEDAATIKVRVVDPDGAPARGLTVELQSNEKGRSGPFARMMGRAGSSEVESGEDGRFTVKAIKPGAYDVTLVPEDLKEIAKENVRLKAGETVDLGTLTAKPGRRIAGRVTDSAGGPVSGADVAASWVEDKVSRSRNVKSGDDGRFRIPGPDDGKLRWFSVSAKGFAMASRTDVAAGDEAVEIVLQHAGRVVGKVQTAEGTAPTAFRVRLHPESKAGEGGFAAAARRSGDERGFSETGGSFEVESVDPGRYTVEAVAQGLAPGKKTGIEVRPEEAADAGTIVLERGATVSGRVLDAKDETPVAGAGVRVSVPGAFGFFAAVRRSEDVAVTGLDGAFRIEGLAAGTQQIAVEHPDYSPAESRVEVQAGEDPPEVVVRLSRGGTVEGAVRDAKRQPVPGAVIMATQGMLGGGEPRSSTTGPEGRYRIERLPAGSYQVLRVPDDPQAGLAGMGMKTAAIKEGETTIVDFDESPKIALRGRVLRGGQPVPSASMFFVSGETAMPGDLKTAQADAAGAYSVGLEHGGKYRVMVQTAEGSLPGGSNVEIVVPEDPAPSVDIVLSATAITGTVRDASGKAVTEAVVVARRDGAGPNDATGQGYSQPDAEGKFSIQGLEPGTYRVSATASGYRTAEAHPVDLTAESAPAPLDLRLERGTPLRGRVVGPTGSGLEGAMVFGYPAGSAGVGMPTTVTTDVNGNFDMTAPSDGPVELVALAGGFAPAHAESVVPAADPESPAVVLRATTGGRIKVQVIDGAGKPVAGAVVLVTPVPPGSWTAVTAFGRQPRPTAMDGTTVVDLLAPGSYQVAVAGKTGVSPAAASVQEGTESVVTIVTP